MHTHILLYTFLLETFSSRVHVFSEDQSSRKILMDPSEGPVLKAATVVRGCLSRIGSITVEPDGPLPLFKAATVVAEGLGVLE